jgi:hypothetical protein
MAAAVKVDKATNELLLGPDWTLNIDICDAVNSDHGYAVVFSLSLQAMSLFLSSRSGRRRFEFLVPVPPE